jgi:recombination protein RecA
MGTVPLPLLEVKGIVVARRLEEKALEFSRDTWNLDALAGRFVELSGSTATAALTVSAGLILEAQRQGEAAAWITEGASTFFPPDFAASGIDLAALPVVRVPDAAQGARAADALVRSGGFAILVLDLASAQRVPQATQSRLAALAKKYHTALICITRKESRAPSLGPLVSIRGHTEMRRDDFDRFVGEVHIEKDRRRDAGWEHAEVFCGLDGLC